MGRQQRAVGVTEVVPAERSQPSSLLRAPEAAAQRRVVKRPAEHVAEHPLIGRGDIRAAADVIERSSGLIGQRHPAHTAGLGRRLDSGAHGACDRQGLSLELHVAPALRQQFAETQSGVGGHAHHLGVLEVLGAVADPLNPHLDFPGVWQVLPRSTELGVPSIAE